MADIVTDAGTLHRISEKAEGNEIDSIISQLKESIPEDALGLAAIQIGIPRRIFLANLSFGTQAFINPEITWTSADRVPSIEGCLSIPDCTRCIERHSQIEVTDLDSDVPMRFKGQDACIIQHECDHINGVLITDYATAKTPELRTMERNKKREERIATARALKQEKKPPAHPKPQKISAKKQVKIKREAKRKKRQARTFRRQAKIRVEIEERYKAEQKKLFSDES